jgi:ribonuclease HI
MLRQNCVVYTDGSCSPNPGPGGWGWSVWSSRSSDLTSVIVHEGSGRHSATTNNQMEMTAVIEALQCIAKNPVFFSGSVKIYSDSSYVILGITQWTEGWKNRGWKTSKGKPVKNIALWKKMCECVDVCAHAGVGVKWEWVKAHAGLEGNERADRLANSTVTPLKSHGFE